MTTSHPHLPPSPLPTTFPSPAQHPSPIQKPRPSSAAHSDAVLPRGSRVRITGNNRTKWDLIGRVGHVRAAQTLGGWHEVQLVDGALVRVQRNALQVLQLAVVPGESAGLVRIEAAGRPAPSLQVVPGVRKRVKKVARGEGGVVGAVKMAVGASGRPTAFANLAKLNVASLRRYRSAYNLNVAKDCTRDELVGAVRRHFEKTKVNESEVISNFIRHIARRGGPAASD